MHIGVYDTMGAMDNMEGIKVEIRSVFEQIKAKEKREKSRKNKPSAKGGISGLIEVREDV